MKVPPAAHRLFPEILDSLLELDGFTAFATTRLLEDGDSADLAALFSQLPEADVISVFRLRGGRQLGRRSRAFWSLLFGLDPLEAEPTGEALWPL